MELAGRTLGVVAVVVDEAFGFGHFREHDAVRIVDAVGTVHDEPPDATGPHVHLVSCRGEAIGTPPLRPLLRIRPRLEHQLSWRIEETSGDDAPIGGRADGTR